MKTSNKAPRFFINQKISKETKFNQELIISDKEVVHKLKNVLRKNEGDSVVFLDNEGFEFFGIISKISKMEIRVEKNKIEFYKKDNSENKNQKIILAPAILKKDNFEFVLQKCTEIGIKNFQPIISERTEKDNLNFERLEKIIKEASEQSEKIFLPIISKTKKLEEFLLEQKKLSPQKNIFTLEFNSADFKISKFKRMGKEIIFLVGPEGGWGENDLNIFEKFNVKKVSLGSQILRAETASISLSSLLLLGE